ncbi:MAG: hypothetical protein PF690_17450 [Deltaproteobacteria bacterium]|jgi:hypothetical protein|nr:hypothetical protein [Deltaproteobacteria bacterium]
MKAIEILFLFFTAVIAGDYKKAHGLTSKTWAEKNGPDKLKAQFKDVPDGLSFEVGQVVDELPTQCAYQVDFKTDNEQGSAKVGLVRESWPRKKDAQGDWGVDPDAVESIILMEVKKVGSGGDEKKKFEAQLKAAEDLIEKGDVDKIEKGDLEKAEKILASIPVDKVPQVVSEQMEKAVAKAHSESYNDGHSALLIKAEDLGIDVPEEATNEQLQKLIETEEKALQDKKEAEKPAPKKAPAKKPAAKKPAANKGGK